MAKSIRVSSDGSNWYTLPGNTGELQNEAGSLDDTIFGQEFSSSQTGMINWTINANALFKGFAGYIAQIKKIGTSTAMTDEAMEVVSGKTYKITASAKNVWDRSVAVVVKDDGSAVDSADIISINYLFGQVTFASGYSVTGAITVSGSYYPLAVVGCANSYTLTQTANANDTTCMANAQSNGGVRVYEYGLKTVTLELSGNYQVSNAYSTLLTSRAELIIEVNPDGNGKTVARGFFKAMNTGQSGNVGDLEEETVTFNLSVPDNDLIPYPYKWNIDATSTLNTSVQKCIDSWDSKELINVAYLPDGTTGVKGEGVITDLTMSGGLDAMTEFTVNIQGSDALVSYS